MWISAICSIHKTVPLDITRLHAHLDNERHPYGAYMTLSNIEGQQIVLVVVPKAIESGGKLTMGFGIEATTIASQVEIVTRAKKDSSDPEAFLTREREKQGLKEK